jgi:hypothetical protein
LRRSGEDETGSKAPFRRLLRHLRSTGTSPVAAHKVLQKALFVCFVLFVVKMIAED